MSRFDIMHEHVNQGDLWPSLSGAMYECKTHRYVAIIEELNHTLWRASKDYKEIMLIHEAKGGIGLETEEERDLPAEKYPYLLLRFDDTYIYLSLYLESISFV